MEPIRCWLCVSLYPIGDVARVNLPGSDLRVDGWWRSGLATFDLRFVIRACSRLRRCDAAYLERAGRRFLRTRTNNYRILMYDMSPLPGGFRLVYQVEG